MADKFDSDLNATIGPSSGAGIDGSDIVFYVAWINGGNGALSATPKAAQIGIGNVLAASFHVPNGTLWIRQNTEVAGAFLARDIIVGEGAQVSLDSYFDTGFQARVATASDPTADNPQGRFSATPIPIATTFHPEQNYPNPFNPETEIRYQLPEASRVVIRIFNLMGEEIRTLIDKTQEAGFFRVRWDGKDAEGHPAASGVYLCQFRAGQFLQVRKMSLVR